MAKAFSFVKEKIHLDLPKSRKQQTHKTIYNGGRAVEDALRESSGHSVSYHTKSTQQIVLGNKFLQSFTLEFQINHKICVHI